MEFWKEYSAWKPIEELLLIGFNYKVMDEIDKSCVANFDLYYYKHDVPSLLNKRETSFFDQYVKKDIDRYFEDFQNYNINNAYTERGRLRIKAIEDHLKTLQSIKTYISDYPFEKIDSYQVTTFVGETVTRPIFDNPENHEICRAYTKYYESLKHTLQKLRELDSVMQFKHVVSEKVSKPVLHKLSDKQINHIHRTLSEAGYIQPIDSGVFRGILLSEETGDRIVWNTKLNILSYLILKLFKGKHYSRIKYSTPPYSKFKVIFVNPDHSSIDSKLSSLVNSVRSNKVLDTLFDQLPTY